MLSLQPVVHPVENVGYELVKCPQIMQACVDFVLVDSQVFVDEDIAKSSNGGERTGF
jgi:hypothetical protein